MDAPISLKKYYIIYSVTYCVTIALLLMGDFLFDLGVPEYGTLMGMIVSGALVAGMKFAEDHQRQPTKKELYRLSFVSTVLYLIISFCIVQIMSLGESDLAQKIELSTQDIAITDLVVVIAIVSFFLHLVLLFTYWITAKMMAKREA